MREILMMTLTPQLRKIAIKKRASHPSSIREPDLDFEKLVDKLEQAEITMKLEETENLKLQYVNNNQTTTSQINNINVWYRFIQKNHWNFKTLREKLNFKGEPSFKKWCIYCRRYGHSIAECRQKQQDLQNKPQTYRDPNKSFHQYMEKDQNLPNKNNHSINSSGKPLPKNLTLANNNHLIIRIIEDDHQIKENSHKMDIVDQTVKTVSIEKTIQDQNQTDLNFRLMPVPIQILGIDIIQLIDLETLHTIEIEIIPTIGIEAIQMSEIMDIKIKDHAIILTTDQIITDRSKITIKIDHAIIHRT